MAKVCPLYSGSSGNSTLVTAGETKLLVDAGVSCKAINTALAGYDLSLKDIDALLITHEHIDHIKGIQIISKNFKVPIYASKRVIKHLYINNHVYPDANLIPFEGEFLIKDISVKPFMVQHDTQDCYGFRMQFSSGGSAAVTTDLGCVDDEVLSSLSGADIVMIESNYDPRMLDCSRYPYMLKQRIKSDRGHLSNVQSALTIVKLCQSGTTRFILSHLSKENNMPEIAYHTVLEYMRDNDMDIDQDYMLCVARRSEPTPAMVL